MTVPFRPTVGVTPERDFLDTVSRAFLGGRALIERERESRRRAEQFETQQQNAALVQTSLESELEAREFDRRRAAFQDPSLVTTPTPPLGGRAGGPGGGGAEPGAEGLFEEGLQPPQGQFDQPIGGDIGAPEAPTEPTFALPEETAFEQPEFAGELVDRPEFGGEVFGEAGGEAVEIPRFDVTAEAPERPGVPPPAPPTVQGALADELQGPQAPRQAPARTPPRAPLQRVGTIGGQQFFFDPEGETRAEQRELTQSGQQVQQVLTGLAAREDAAGRTAEGDHIRAQMNEIIAQVEAGTGDPSQLITSILARARQNAQLQQFRDFLTSQVGEENVPDGLNDLPLPVQVEELQQVRTRLNRPERQEQPERGALSEASITSGVRQMLLDMSIVPSEATPEQVNNARAQVLRFARGADPGQATTDRSEQAGAEFQRIATSLIQRIERGIAQLEESDETQQILADVADVKGQVATMSREQLRQTITILSERELDVRAALGEPNVRGRPETQEGRSDVRQGGGGGAL